MSGGKFWTPSLIWFARAVRGDICQRICRIGKPFINILACGASKGGGKELISGCAPSLEKTCTGRQRQASAVCLGFTVGKNNRHSARQSSIGFDAGKRVEGRKRHILVDTLGLLMVVAVHAANISETARAKLVLAVVERRFWRLRLIWLDGGYKNSLFEWIEQLVKWRKIRIVQVNRNDGQRRFAVLPKRWIVERTFGWLIKQRRLSKNYENLPETSEAMIYAAMIRLMLARLECWKYFSDTLKGKKRWRRRLPEI